MTLRTERPPVRPRSGRRPLPPLIFLLVLAVAAGAVWWNVLRQDSERKACIDRGGGDEGQGGARAVDRVWEAQEAERPVREQDVDAELQSVRAGQVEGGLPRLVDADDRGRRELPRRDGKEDGDRRDQRDVGNFGPSVEQAQRPGPPAVRGQSRIPPPSAPQISTTSLPPISRLR